MDIEICTPVGLLCAVATVFGVWAACMVIAMILIIALERPW